MRKISRTRWMYVGAIGTAALSALIVQALMAQPPSSKTKQSAGSPSALGAAGAAGPAAQAAASNAQLGEASGEEGYGASSSYGMDSMGHGTGPGMSLHGIPLNFTIVSANGDVEGYTTRRFYTYMMEAGAAKPKRLAANPVTGGFGGDMSGGYGGESAGYGMGGGMGLGGYGGESAGYGMGGYAPGSAMGSGMEKPQEKQWPILYALVVDETDAQTDEADRSARATIKVAVQISVIGSDAAMSGMSGAMPGAEAMYGSAQPVFVEIDAEQISSKIQAPLILKSVPKEERINLAQLIRLDVWIEDARTALRAKRDDPQTFAAVESHLKKLLTEEYDALLGKQRGEAERLRRRLDQLQKDLERRAQAKDRVVDVQLGKLVLEAQGLIDSQR